MAVLKELNKIEEKLTLEYPCNWDYKLIGLSESKILATIESMLSERPYSIKPSNKSRSGKYSSIHLSLLVHSDDDRREIFYMLKNETAIKMVL